MENYSSSFRQASKTTLVLNLEKSFGWYDFSVKVIDHNHFEKKYAGRVETGQSSYSDPFVGKAIV